MSSGEVKPVTAYLGIGSNIEPRRHFVQCAVALAKAFANPRWSTVYMTEAVGMVGPRFMNAAVSIECACPIETLLSFTKNLERELGRTEDSAGYKNRTLDIDILLFGDACTGTQELVVPAPTLHTDAHTLLPLAEIAPEVVHPELQRTLAELLQILREQSPGQFLSVEPADLSLEQYASPD